MAFKNHPFAVNAFFKNSTVLTFYAPKEELEKLLPPRLRLDTFEDKWAFVAAAMVQTKELRPAGFPKFLGKNFFLTGFRVFVRYTTSEGKNLRGLYIIKSETDKKFMEFFGNVFTHYNYTTTDVQLEETELETKISSENSDFQVLVDKTKAIPELPQNSPFKTWKEARKYAGPLPFTFTYNQEKDEMLIIQGKRSNWNPTPIHVTEQKFGFIETLNPNLKLANAFQITNIPYQWEKGRIDKW